MSAAFLRVGTRAQSASAASLAPVKPAVNGLNGILLAVVSSKNNATHSTATAGWGQVGTQQNSGASFTSSLWIAAEGAGAPTFTWTGAVACQAQIAYYADPNNPLDPTPGSTTVGSGLTATHTSASLNTTRDLSLVVYVDVAAANTALALPVGWTENVDAGSATDVGRTVFGSKAVNTSGSASGAISVTGANAAWVQRQIELKITAAPGLEQSKIETIAWLDPNEGLSSSKIEAVAWLESLTLQFSKIEVVAWVEPGIVPPTDEGGCFILW